MFPEGGEEYVLSFYFCDFLVRFPLMEYIPY
jgi:hypothetical protein